MLRIIIFLILFVPFTGHTQFLSKYQEVLNLTYTPTASTNAEALYLNSFYHFLEAVLYGDEQAYAEFFDSYEATIKAIETGPPSESNQYFETELMIQSGFLKLKFGHELAAVWSMRTAYRNARKNYESNPGSPLFKRSWGLMQVLVGAIPDNYQWLPEMFGFSGSITFGQELLADIPFDHWLYTESRVMIQLTRSYLLDESALAAKEFGTLNSLKSPLLDYLYTTVLLRAHKASDVIRYYENLSNPLSLTTYIAANAALQGSRYQMADTWFNTFLKTYPGQDFKKDATYKLFLSSYLTGNEKSARTYFDKISQTGNTMTESDRYAQRAAGLPWPNSSLMKIRLATDGGFYAIAEQEIQKLDQADFDRMEEKTEFEYRKARLYHFVGDSPKAKSHYLRTIELQEQNKWYYAPNSCLQLGYLYLKDGDLNNAELYFKKVREYRGYEYEKGIERKAHSALSTHFGGS